MAQRREGGGRGRWDRPGPLRGGRPPQCRVGACLARGGRHVQIVARGGGGERGVVTAAAASRRGALQRGETPPLARCLSAAPHVVFSVHFVVRSRPWHPLPTDGAVAAAARVPVVQARGDGEP